MIEKKDYIHSPFRFSDLTRGINRFVLSNGFSILKINREKAEKQDIKHNSTLTLEHGFKKTIEGQVQC